MALVKATILDSSEPLSKALDELLTTGTAVVITKGGKYFGIVDDRNIRAGIKDPNNVKCESVAVKAPRIYFDLSLPEKISRFSAGYFKALPVVNKDDIVLGLYTLDMLLLDMLKENVFSSLPVSEFMAKPAYAIERTETFGAAKTKMKKLKTHHLVVVSKGKVEGVVSTHDFLAFIGHSRDRQGFQLVSQITNENDLPISDFLREPAVLLSPNISLKDAVREMAERKVSYAVVVDESRKPLGILSASDIIKESTKLFSYVPEVVVTGLSGEDLYHHDEIKNAVAKALEKFSKSFDISKCTVHVKKGKSTYKIDATIIIDQNPIHITMEKYNIAETTRLLVDEILTVLRKLKDKKSEKKTTIIEEEEYL
ncbi:MAG: CBS domain-containing protein [Candidatus Anstonellales archaeon]